jgi:hypothetical protein
MDIVTEGHTIGIEAEELYIPSAFCVKKAEPEVSLFYDGGLGVATCRYVNVCVF